MNRIPWGEQHHADFERQFNHSVSLAVTSEDLFGPTGNELELFALGAFVEEGALTTAVLDGGDAVRWGGLDWSARTPAQTFVDVSVRASADAGDLGPWRPVAAPGTPLDRDPLVPPLHRDCLE